MRDLVPLDIVCDFLAQHSWDCREKVRWEQRPSTLTSVCRLLAFFLGNFRAELFLSLQKTNKETDLASIKELMLFSLTSCHDL